MKLGSTLQNGLAANRAAWKLAAAVLTCFVCAGWYRHAEALVIYHDRSAWTAAISEHITADGFDTGIAFGPSITFSSGVVSDAAGNNPIAAVLNDSNTVANGAYHGRVDTSGAFANTFATITWILPQPIFALGADWLSTTSQARLLLTGDFDGTGDVVIDFFGELGTPGTGFLGIIGTGTFSSVVLGTQLRSDEAFAMDNLSFAPGVVSSAPTSALLGAGLALLALLRRRSAA